MARLDRATQYTRRCRWLLGPPVLPCSPGDDIGDSVSPMHPRPRSGGNAGITVAHPPRTSLPLHPGYACYACFPETAYSVIIRDELASHMGNVGLIGPFPGAEHGACTSGGAVLILRVQFCWSPQFVQSGRSANGRENGRPRCGATDLLHSALQWPFCYPHT
jgi:hypothetical protein